MSLLLLVGLALCAGLGLLVLDALVRRPILATRLVLSVVVLFILVEDGRLLTIQIAGFQISPRDLIFSLILGAAALRFLRLQRTSPQQKALVVLGAMCIVSLLLGITQGPFDSAVNEFRHFLGFVGAALYFSTVQTNIETREAMARSWLWAGVLLGGLVILRWTAAFTGLSLGVFDTQSSTTLRVVDGQATMTIATIALILLLPALHGRSLEHIRQQQVGAALLLVSVMLNRRTLWLGLGVMLIVLVVRNPHLGRRMTAFLTLGLVLFAATVPVLARDEDAAADIAVGVTDTENLDWRVEGWTGLWESGPDGADEYLIGLPFGSGYDVSTEEGVERTSTPHNFYLQTYLRTGIVGAIALLLALSLSAAALVPKTGGANDRPFARDHLFLLLVLLVIWMFAWLPSAELGIVLGLAVSAVSFSGERSQQPFGRLSNAVHSHQ